MTTKVSAAHGSCRGTWAGRAAQFPSDPRLTIRGRFLNINFQTNPRNGDDICLMHGFIDMSFENCTIPNLQPTMSKHVLFLNCRSINSGEPDKIIETLVFDGGTTGEFGRRNGRSILAQPQRPPWLHSGLAATVP